MAAFTATIEVVEGETYGSLPSVARPGYTFSGWFTATSGGDRVTADTVVDFAEPKTIYARGNTRTFKITLDGQDATTSGTNAVYYQYGTYFLHGGKACWYFADEALTQPLVAISKPVRKGYKFDEHSPHTRDFSRELGEKMIAINGGVWYNINMEESTYFSTSFDVTHGRGYVYSLQYHIVWCTKYRKKVIHGILENELAEYIKETAKTLQMDILAMETMPDHIHILVSCKPQLRLSDAIKVLKGNTSRWLFIQHPELKKQLWGGHLWNPSYFVATVSERSREQIERYIENQKNH